jgi:hypothetical protein
MAIFTITLRKYTIKSKHLEIHVAFLFEVLGRAIPIV